MRRQEGRRCLLVPSYRMRFTLYGAYEYLDHRLFEGVSLPDGMDMDSFEHYVLEQYGELYPYQQEPHILQIGLQKWSARRISSWTKMYAALAAEYSPIENYDRHESRDYQERGKDTDSLTLGSQNVTTPQDTQTNKLNVSAYDQTEGFTPREETVSTRGGTITTKSSGTDTTEKSYGRGTSEDIHAHGNIGVTTNQQMITSELELRKYDLYQVIARELEDEFLCQVY